MIVNPERGSTPNGKALDELWKHQREMTKIINKLNRVKNMTSGEKNRLQQAIQMNSSMNGSMSLIIKQTPVKDF